VLDEVIARDYEATSLFQTPAFHEAILARRSVRTEPGLARETYLIRDVLATVRATQGDVDTHLVAQGLSAAEVEQLRELLLGRDGVLDQVALPKTLANEGGSYV
jgi:hypothetical protein